MKTLSEITGRKAAVFAFARMNPPTSGHEKLVRGVLESAKKNNATPLLFISSSTDGKNNPLTREQKVKYLTLGISEVRDILINDDTIKTPFDAMKYVEDMGYTSAIFVAGSDRVSDLYPKMLKYVNHPDKTKSFRFESFSVINAGDRNLNSDDVSGASSTKMRMAAKSNNINVFAHYAPSNLSTRFVKEMFDDVRAGLDIEDIVETVQRLSNTLNISRSEMPQIKGDFIIDFIDTLKERGVSVSNQQVSVDALRPTQNEINLDKVKDKYNQLKTGAQLKPFIISTDNFILDGHHQLFALKKLDKNLRVPCFVVGLKMLDLLKHARNYSKTTYKNIMA